MILHGNASEKQYYYESILVISLQGMNIGLLLPYSPEFWTYSGQTRIESNDTYVEYTYELQDDSLLYILKIEDIFPNILFSDNVEKESEDDDEIDFSQYVLEE